jgi:hypothetical protein
MRIEAIGATGGTERSTGAATNRQRIVTICIDSCSITTWVPHPSGLRVRIFRNATTIASLLRKGGFTFRHLQLFSSQATPDEALRSHGFRQDFE